MPTPFERPADLNLQGRGGHQEGERASSPIVVGDNGHENTIGGDAANDSEDDVIVTHVVQVVHGDDDEDDEEGEEENNEEEGDDQEEARRDIDGFILRLFDEDPAAFGHRLQLWVERTMLNGGLQVLCEHLGDDTTRALHEALGRWLDEQA